ncbi:MAG: OmpA family protein [Stagnimonas sp.]|nr:OmpA family protein [Stagnimonas sp.]
MRKKAALLLIFAGLLPAHAQEPVAVEAVPVAEVVEVSETAQDVVQVSEANQYFAVLPGYFGADKSRGGTGDGVTVSGIYGYRFSPHWGVELNLMGSSIETGNDKGTDFYQLGGTADLVYGLKDRSLSWTPFVLIGIGGVNNDIVPNSQDKISLIGNVGLGVVTGPLTSLGFKLRAEGRYQRDQFQGDYDDYRVLGGIEFPFGTRTVALSALTPPAVEIREVFVPAPFIDSDKDTIEDSRDKCADTPEGLKVDADGCVIEGQAMELKGVTFAFNSAQLQLNAQTVLDYVVKGMKGQPSMTVEIAGHTDSAGPQAYNQKLSQQRAESVNAYLTAQGIDAGRLTAKGYGETELLIKPEISDTDKERNRRVVFHVVGK